MNNNKKINYKNLIKHETKRHALFKFLSVLVIFIGYFAFISYKYGLEQGFFVAMLSWSFFVLSTPIADAGFLVDFPVRLLTNLRMIHSEIFVWITAISLNTYAILFRPEIYDKTILLNLLKDILIHPIPFWIIILLSMLGTFISIRFGDELFDKINHSERTFYHKHKYNYRFIVMIFLFAMIFVLYKFLLQKLGINIHL